MDSIAVGSRIFVEKVKALLGFRVIGREVIEGGGGYHPWEGNAPLRSGLFLFIETAFAGAVWSPLYWTQPFSPFQNWPISITCVGISRLFIVILNTP